MLCWGHAGMGAGVMLVWVLGSCWYGCWGHAGMGAGVMLVWVLRSCWYGC